MTPPAVAPACDGLSTSPSGTRSSVFDPLYLKTAEPANLRLAWQEVRRKGSSGGIDGETIHTFADSAEPELQKLRDELLSGRFVPQPYKQVNIPKKDGDSRALGLMSIRDKIVQQSARGVLEPILDRMFLDVSYGYRAGKGTGKAIKRVAHMIRNEKRVWLTRCDIDGYFDNIEHERLLRLLTGRISAPDFVRLIQVWLQMGRVTGNLKWKDSIKGIPQGGVISPLLSNFYLNPMDHFCVEKKYGLVRYADDFIILSHTEEIAKKALADVTRFLQDRLKLRLNEGCTVINVNTGFEFLGVTFQGNDLSLSETKMARLKDKLKSAVARDCMRGSRNTTEEIAGIQNYYARLVPQNLLEQLDQSLAESLRDCAKREYEAGRIKNKEQIETLLNQVSFLSDSYNVRKKGEIRDILAACVKDRTAPAAVSAPEPIKDPVKKRKREYQKLQAEGFELVVTRPGSFLGKTQKGITVKVNGQVVHQAPLNNLKHIIVATSKASLSGAVIQYAARQKIPIDFVEYSGQPYARISHFNHPDIALHLAQLEAQRDGRATTIAKQIVDGKIRNQMNLAKYYNKYRKSVDEGFVQTFAAKLALMEGHVDEIDRLIDQDHEIVRGKLFSIEGRAAAAYWEISKTLLDEIIVFEGRVGQGAKDMVNSLLNYGYAILYGKIWNAVLKAGLNPHISFLHKPQSGKPTLIFDLTEEFRAQAVDRVVFSMINKRVELKMDKGQLCQETRNKLIEGVLERINTTEKFRGVEMRFYEIIINQSKALAAYLTGEATRYAPYIGKW
ncbi:MAG TPA: CRISPR-associated endonuclease Cas1 [Desulfuromonadales bacterium]|nr:CRISPR-associated endonuclease Cas1 [Desulfuromonadales bacterium]